MRILDKSWEKCILEKKFRERGKYQEDEPTFCQINQQTPHPLAWLLADTHNTMGYKMKSPCIFLKNVYSCLF